MRQQLVMLAIAFYAAIPASFAYAHHSHPYFYDECKRITIEGRVETVEFKDPHSSILLTLDDGTRYAVDWAPVSRLTAEHVSGPAKESLTSGARITVTGNRVRPVAQIREHFPDFTGEVNPNTVDPISIRAGDSFSWALPARASLPDCNGR